MLVGKGCDEIEDLNGLLLGDLRLIGDGGGELGLGECFGHDMTWSRFCD